MILSARDREHAQALVSRRLGLEFRGSRLRDLEQAVARAALAEDSLPLATYLARLAQLPDESPEWRRLAADLTVCETYFFRERPCFDALEESILPPLIAERRAQGFPSLRMWSAGCSTGEEPYSLAIVLDRLLPDRSDWTITILGTDLDVDALEQATRAVYREWSFRTLPPGIRERYFRPHGDDFELDPRIREMVRLEPLNLMADTYPALASHTTWFDVILCRNVLMYLTHEAQREVLARLERSLAPRGWLAVGFTEAMIEPTGSLVQADVSPGVFLRIEPQPIPPTLPASELARAGALPPLRAPASREARSVVAREAS